MRPTCRSASALAAIFLFSYQSALVDAAGYKFINIADNATIGPQGPLSFLSIFPSISGDKVAFSATSGGLQRMYVGSGGPLTTIASPGDLTSAGEITGFMGLAAPSISGNTVAFAAATSAGPAVFKGDGGPLTTIVKVGDPAPGVASITNVGDYVGIDDGQVAFLGSIPGGRGIFRGDGGPLTTIAKRGDTTSFGVLHPLAYSKALRCTASGLTATTWYFGDLRIVTA